VNRDELRKLIVGIVTTVPTPFDAQFEVDYGRMAELTQFWVESGLVAGKAVIKVAAAMGEGGMLEDAEWANLLRTTVQAAKGKAAIAAGIHHKDTRRAIKDARLAEDLGAVAVQVSPPVFSWPTAGDLLRHFEAISDAIGIGVIIYNNWWWPGGNVSVDTFLKMADFEHIVAIKWSVQDESKYDEMARLTPYFNVIDNQSRPARCHQLGGRGYINRTAHAYPPHDLRIWELLEARRYDEAQRLYDSIDVPTWQFYERLALESGGEARMIKGMMEIMGHPCGASRPPTLPMSRAQMAELRQILIAGGWPVPPAR
jgi:4-hydroxy-tetrahydrodipicolinate synthase